MNNRSLIEKKYLSMLLGGTVSSIVAELVTLSDSIVAGLLLRKEEVSAICLIYPLVSLSWFFILIVSFGATIVYSKYIGAFEKEQADRTFGNGVITTVGVGILLFLKFTIFSDNYLRFYGAEGEVFLLASKYLSWIRVTMMITPVSYFVGTMAFADGDENTVTISRIASTVVNVVASVLLCTRFGIDGIGMGSVLGVVAGLLIILIHFTREKNTLRFRFYCSLSLTMEVAKFSVVDGGKYLFLSVYLIVLNKFVLTVFGDDKLILVSVILLLLEIQLVFEGVGESATPFISVYLAEENLGGIRKVWKLALKSVWVEGFLTTALLIIFSTQLPRIFDITEGPVKVMATWGIVILSFGHVFAGLYYLTTSYLLIIEKIRLGFITTMLNSMVCPIVFGCGLGYVFGIYGLFAGIAISPAVTVVILYTYLCLAYGKENVPLLLQDMEADKKYGFFEFVVSPQDIVNTRDEIGKELEICNVPKLTVSRLMLLFEEVSMITDEQNAPAKVLGECAVIVYSGKVRIITRFDGKEIDLSNSDMKAGSLREYSLYRLIATRGLEGRALPAMSFNRNEFQVDY